MSFNPRSREGSDKLQIAQMQMQAVSIHAPAKGATMNSEYSGDCITSFNPRSREGSDFGNFYFSNKHTSFNPRSREGSDQRWIMHPDLHRGFNPRSREGSDDWVKALKDENIVSIHAPAKGATAISAKNSFQFSAKINKLSFYILIFPLFPSPLFSTFHFICAYFRVRIPRHFYVCFLFALLYYHKIYHLLQFYNRHIFLFYL